jgi:hypothetical protein
MNKPRRETMKTAKEKITIAEAIVANGFAGRVWCPDANKDTSPVRIYGNGMIVINDDGAANINDVKRAAFDSAKSACDAAGVTHKRG